jgi:hypothetical protein
LAWLRQHDLIEHDLAKARISQFVIVSGSLIILDRAMLKSMWELKPIRDTILRALQANNVLQSLPTSDQQGLAIDGATQGVTDLESEFDAFMAIISILPHSVQARLIGDNVNIWCGLEEGGIVGKSSDLLLKHGTLISGEWSMLGILDASPGPPLSDDMTETIATLAATPIGQIAARFAPIAKTLLGRPDSAYGMTPLLIYREVSGG